MRILQAILSMNHPAQGLEEKADHHPQLFSGLLSGR